MINLSKISVKSRLGRGLRLPLRLIPAGTVLRVLRGPLRGARWVAGSTNHGAWLGSYEWTKQQVFAQTIRPGFTVWDIGANVGFYTLLASRLVGAEGRVVSFEPLPQNVLAMERHLRLNGIENVEVVQRAVSDQDGTVAFQRGENDSEGRVDDGGEVRVDSIRLETFWRAFGRVPDVLKMDIEGGEVVALKGGVECLRACHPTVFLATHGRDLHVECCKILTELGYGLSSVDPAVPIEMTDEIVASWTGAADE